MNQNKENAIYPWLLSQTSIHTRRAYERVIYNFIESINCDLNEVTTREIAMFLSKVRESGGHSKFNQARSALSSFFNFQIRSGQMSLNPTLAFKTKRISLPTKRFIPSEDIYSRVVAGEESLRNQIMLHSAFVLGLRLSELLTIRLESFFWSNSEKVFLSVNGKGGKNRDVFVPHWLWNLIEQYAIEQSLEENDFLFHSMDSKLKHLSHSQVYRIFIVAGERVGLRKSLSPHKYRHGHATTALSRGASIKALMDQMGHENWDTLRRYVTEVELTQPSEFFKEAPPLLLK